MYNSYWYSNLIKPAFTPPAVIFSPVWIFLYATLLVSLILFSVKPAYENKLLGYLCFITQMLLNLIWSPAFFYFKNIGLALIIIILLDIFVILTMKRFFTVSKTAAIILLPYLIWISFATYLNTGFFILNR